MKKQLHLNQIVEGPRAEDVVSPISINFEDVVSYSKFSLDPNYQGKTIIRVNSPAKVHHVIETYDQIRKMMEDLRVADDRPSYRVQLGYQVHYIPKDTVARIIVNEPTSETTLVFHTGEKLDTKMTMVQLRETTIEIPF